MAIRLGIAKIKVDGDLVESLPGASIDIGGIEREAVLGSFSIHGHTEKIKPAMVECEISVGPDTDLLAIGNWVDVTVLFEADTGQTYVVSNAFNTVTPKATEGEGGKVAIALMGDPAQQS